MLTAIEARLGLARVADGLTLKFVYNGKQRNFKILNTHVTYFRGQDADGNFRCFDYLKMENVRNA